MPQETIDLRGHIIDSLTLPKILDQVINLGGSFEIEEFSIGKVRTDPSYAQIKVSAPSLEILEQIIEQVKRNGAEVLEKEDARTEAPPKDGVFPENFYSTTNLETEVRMNGEWKRVENIEMDCGILAEQETGQAHCVPMHRVKNGDRIVIGHRGIRVLPLERQERGPLFAFMTNSVSSERPIAPILDNLAELILEKHAKGGKVLFVGGPAIVHSGGAAYLADLVMDGAIDVLFAGNALAAHDIEQAMFGTSLGMPLSGAGRDEHSHQNHLRAINAIRLAGSIAKAVESGLLRQGIMYSCVKKQIPFVLAGSIRDDGPLPEVITDVMEAQDKMRELARGVEVAIMVATTLHSIATGNILPARTQVFCVDVNPNTVSKLVDRGSFQAFGLVSSAELFLLGLLQALENAKLNKSI